MTNETIIITCSHDPRFKLDKEKIKRLLKQADLEVIRIERARWT